MTWWLTHKEPYRKKTREDLLPAFDIPSTVANPIREKSITLVTIVEVLKNNGSGPKPSKHGEQNLGTDQQNADGQPLDAAEDIMEHDDIVHGNGGSTTRVTSQISWCVGHAKT